MCIVCRMGMHTVCSGYIMHFYRPTARIYSSFRAASLALEQSCVTGRLPHDKMTGMLHTPYSKAFSSEETFCILLRILMKFVFEGPIDNRLALVWLVLDEQFINECLRHQAWMHNCSKFFGSQSTNKLCVNHTHRIHSKHRYFNNFFSHSSHGHFRLSDISCATLFQGIALKYFD